MIIDAKLNKNDLYAVDSTYLSKSNVAVFPHIHCSTLARSGFFLRSSLGHLPRASMIYLAKDGFGEKRMTTN